MDAAELAASPWVLAAAQRLLSPPRGVEEEGHFGRMDDGCCCCCCYDCSYGCYCGCDYDYGYYDGPFWSVAGCLPWLVTFEMMRKQLV